MPERRKLRKAIRANRRRLSPKQQQQAATTAARLVANSPLFRRSKHIAFYLAADGELDPAILLTEAAHRGKHCYLPIVGLNNKLQFARYRPGDKLSPNTFGILEPSKKNVRPAWAIQLVITPMVAFDHAGFRLGMGGGYYDRCFSSKHQSQKKTPFLLGYAHSFQEVETVHHAHWDVPLQGVATEHSIRFFNGNS